MTLANCSTLRLCWLALMVLGANVALAHSSLDFDPAGEYATQFHGGPYSEAPGSGLGGSIALALANANVASFDGTQSESLAANAFTNGARFTVGAFFKMSSLAAGSTNRGILRLGLSNGGTDNFTGLPFASIMLDSSGASFLAYRSGTGAEPVDDATFTLATNQWYYFESTFTRSGDTGTTLIDYSITLANAAADGTIGSVIATYSPASSTGHEAASTALNGALYGAFRGYDAFPTAAGVMDNFFVSSAGGSQLPAPPPPGLKVTGGNFVGAAFQLAVDGFDTFRQYRLQRWTNLAVAVPTLVGSATTPVSQTGTMTDLTPPGRQAFYRVAQAAAPKPNIIVILMDDLGYNDVGVQTYPSTSNYYPNSGPTPQPNLPSPDPDIPPPNQARLLTPQLDSLAAQGLRMTSFHSSPQCSPTRASLLTGRYDRRVDINIVFFPHTASGLNTREVTLPEALREQGYATGMIGKWHLGYYTSAANPFQLMPTRHGFEEFLGAPHSNDMWPYPLIEDETVLDPDFSPPSKMAQLTWRYTERALDFIQRKTAAGKPFFLYLAHTMPHIPVYPSDQTYSNADGTTWPMFLGSSGISSYYDVVKEVDHSIGRIVAKLDALGIATNTIVIFTSDNGPWLNFSSTAINTNKNSVGSAYPLRDSKMTTWEGSCRVPFIVRWPGRIPPGTVAGETAGMVDLFPTLVGLAGGLRPTDRTLDGINLWPLWSNEPGWQSPRTSYALFERNVGSLGAVIQGDWKLRGSNLYNLTNDIQESTNLAASQPVKLAELQAAWNTVNSSIAAENQSRGVYTPFETQFSTNTVTVPAGGTATFQVRLSANPTNSVTVQVGRVSGYTGIAVSANATLVFNSANWSAWQTVTLAANGNTNAVSGGATFRITSPQIDAVREVFAFRQ